MPVYNGGALVLDARETELFRQRLQNPDRDMLNKRDAFLTEIKESICIEKADKGVEIIPPQCIKFLNSPLGPQASSNLNF